MPPSKTSMKMVGLVVSDVRTSTWTPIPPDKRKLVDHPLPNVPIYGVNAFENLTARIRGELGIGEHDAFVISLPDQIAEISSNNLNILKEEDHLFVLENLKQELPFPVSLPAKFRPHPNTLTDQDGMYHGNENQNAVAFALAELVDNSLSATALNTSLHKPRNIEIRFCDAEASSSILVLDNGCGMSYDVLQSALVFKAPKEARRNAVRNFIGTTELVSCSPVTIVNRMRNNAPSDDYNVDNEYPMYLNSDISKFGAGMKQACFFLGEEVRIMTKSAESQNVLEVFCSKKVLDQKENNAEDPWMGNIAIRKPGQYNAGEHRYTPKEEKIIKEAVASELKKGKESFTHIFITKIYMQKGISRLDLLRVQDGLEEGISVERQLGNIHHYYIHGRNCYDETKADAQSKNSAKPIDLVDLVVTRISGDRQISTNLRHLTGPMENLEHQYISTAADSLYFSIEISKYNEATASKSFKVGGVLRYHPFKFDHETHPDGFVSRKKCAGGPVDLDDGDGQSPIPQGGDSDEEEEENQTEAGVAGQSGSGKKSRAQRCSDFFHIFWNGRLIPNTKWESFDWCSPPTKGKTGEDLNKWYDRLSGSLYLDSNIEAISDITCTKLEITVKNKLKDMFNQSRIGGQVSTVKRLDLSDGIPKPFIGGSRDPAKMVVAWVRKCHHDYDKQVTYTRILGSIKLRLDESTKDFNIFGEAKWNTNLHLKVDSLVKFKEYKGGRIGKVVGKIVGFLVEHSSSGRDSGMSAATVGETIQAPLGWVKVRQLPEGLFNDAEEDCMVYKRMTLLDMEKSQEDVRQIVQERERDLDMELVLVPFKGKCLEEGMEVQIDTSLIQFLKVDVRRKWDKVVLQGHLFHPLNDKKGKKISLVYRIFKLEQGGELKLFHTSALSHFASGKDWEGHFFKDLNLKMMDITEPGKYKITILSYVDVHDEHRGRVNAGVVLPALPSNLPSAGPSSSGLPSRRGRPSTLPAIAAPSTRRPVSTVALPKARRGSGFKAPYGRTSPYPSPVPATSPTAVALPSRRIARVSLPIPAISARRPVSSKPGKKNDNPYPVTIPATENPEDFDEIGRHTLRCGNKKILLPRHEGVVFHVVAGIPSKIRIESVGVEGEVEIGTPFEVRLSFEDGKGNPTRPVVVSRAALKPDDNELLTVVPVKSNPASTVTLDLSNCQVRQDGDLVIISNVVALGLLNAVHREYKFAAHIKQKKVISSSDEKARIFIGPPHSLQIQEQTIQVENGDRPYVTCNVLDTARNLIKFTTKPDGENCPIFLHCTIYDGNSDTCPPLYGDLKVVASKSPTEPQPLQGVPLIEFPALATGEVDELNLLCKLELHREGDTSIQATFTLKVTPSKKPQKLSLHFTTPNGGFVDIKEGQEVTRKVLDHIHKMSFSVTDGMGSEVEYDPSLYEFSFEGWPNGLAVDDSKVKYDFGELPDMEIPPVCRNRRKVKTVFASKENKEGTGVKLVHKFYLTSTPLEAKELRAMTGVEMGRELMIPVDEAYGDDILLTFYDEHGNQIRDESTGFTVHDIEIETETRDLTFQALSYQDLLDNQSQSDPIPDTQVIQGSFIIRNLRFDTPPPLGKKELEIRVGRGGTVLKTLMKVKMVPGQPKGLAFEVDSNLMESKKEAVNHGNMSRVGIRVHLVDACRNTVPYPLVCNIRLTGHPKMLLETQVSNTVTTSREGIANFNQVKIGVNPGVVPTPCLFKQLPCTGLCYNTLPLMATVEFPEEDETSSLALGLPEGRCHFHITCRSDTPAKFEVSAGSVGQYCYEAGGNFNELTVTVRAEDQTLIDAVVLKNLTLTLSEGEASSGVARFSISPMGVQGGLFFFGGVPGRSGRYSMTLVFDNGDLRFEQRLLEPLRIIANAVTALEPENMEDVEQFSIVVSNDPEDKMKRSIAVGLRLFLKDEHKNKVTHVLTSGEIQARKNLINGSLTISVSGEGGTPGNVIKFENPDLLTKRIPITDGLAIIPDIVLHPDTNLPNESRNIVHFQGQLLDGTQLGFDLEFGFYNDISKQKERQELEGQKLVLANNIRSIRTKLDSFQQHVTQLQQAENNLKQIEESYRSRFGMERNIRTLDHITVLENEIKHKQEQLRRDQRQHECTVERFQCPAVDKNKVVGPGGIGHLVQIEEEPSRRGQGPDLRVQRVLSWHLQRYLPVIVVRNEKEGRELVHKYRTQKEFMLSDLLRPATANWNEEIPPNLRAFGNPVYIRKLLQITATSPDDIQITKKVFEKILGRTVLVDRMEDATQYMKAYNHSYSRSAPCPTILTRDGFRLQNDAVIGGNRNQAPPLAAIHELFGLVRSTGFEDNLEMLKKLGELKSKVRETMEATNALKTFRELNTDNMQSLQFQLNKLLVDEKKILAKLESLIKQQSQRFEASQSQLSPYKNGTMNGNGGTSAGSNGRVQSPRRSQEAIRVSSRIRKQAQSPEDEISLPVVKRARK